MERFARFTGLDSDVAPRRYLWTDAFAVCNYLGLGEATGDERALDLALELVDQVHRTLGRHRSNDPREGWISGLTEDEGHRHPTAGGLRIGKPLPERRPDESPDPRTEWDRDGQYYHYLTRWMHALHRVWQVTSDATYHGWAVELAAAAHRGFLTGGDRDGGPTRTGTRRLYWKMSIDLSRPLVPSTGHHDPLDGFLTLGTLAAGAPPRSNAADTLAGPIRDLRDMCRGARWVTDDPLGAGGLLVDMYRGDRLERTDRTEGPSGPDRAIDEEILGTLVHDALRSLEIVGPRLMSVADANRRLAFRELGLSIGLRAAGRLIAAAPLPGALHIVSEAGMQRLERHLHLADDVETFWTDPTHRAARGWSEHREISRVMLATSLAPDGFLGSE